eukprot:2805368-Amphidinium_carterae.1
MRPCVLAGTTAALSSKDAAELVQEARQNARRKASLRAAEREREKARAAAAGESPPGIADRHLQEISAIKLFKEERLQWLQYVDCDMLCRCWHEQIHKIKAFGAGVIRVQCKHATSLLTTSTTISP